MKTRITLLLACLAVLLTGCGNVGDLLPGHIKVAYVVTNTPGQIQATYDTFNGSDWNELGLRAGQLVTGKVNVVIRAGKIHLTILNPDGVTQWEKEFSKDAADTFSFTAASAGEYDIIVEGKNTSGSYQIIWGAN
jgi:hypothetical protein